MTTEHLMAVEPGLAPGGVYCRVDCCRCGPLTTRTVTADALAALAALPDLMATVAQSAGAEILDHFTRGHPVTLAVFDGDDGHRVGIQCAMSQPRRRNR